LITQGAFCAIMREGKFGLTQILMGDRADGKGLNLIGGHVEEREKPLKTQPSERRSKKRGWM
jgi:hypothetical protein